MCLKLDSYVSNTYGAKYRNLVILFYFFFLSLVPTKTLQNNVIFLLSESLSGKKIHQ